MKDKTKDFGKVVPEPKAGGTEVKCAEIKAIPTGGSAFGDRHKFKIGEYNRATASFEMNSTEDLGPREARPKFDLSQDSGPCHYFKSSFARSMVSGKSKSLDCGFGKEEPEGGAFWTMPGKENWDLRRAQPAEVREDESTSGSPTGDPPSALQKSDDRLRSRCFPEDRPASRGDSSSFRRFGGDALLRSPLTSSCRSSFHRSYSSASDVDSVMLQCQVTTLQWQLRQAEASRQMYRAVMEQVVSFLQKTHKDLDVLQSRLEDGDPDAAPRVPRSRSVHAVDASPAALTFQKAKSFVQIGGDPDCPKHGAMFREATWRRTRKQEQDPEEVNPSRISEEAFRLLRTVKSLLGTREPDLASRLSATCSSPATIPDVSSASSTLDSDHSDHFPTRGPPPKDPPPPPPPPLAQGPRRRRPRPLPDPEPKASPPQLSISSADDESGFSSLNSFQEIGVPVANSTFLGQGRRAFEEVGLPGAEEPCGAHRRWSSTPVAGHLPKLRPASLCTPGDVIRVLWV